MKKPRGTLSRQTAEIKAAESAAATQASAAVQPTADKKISNDDNLYNETINLFGSQDDKAGKSPTATPAVATQKSKLSNEDVAKLVIRGNYGVGADRIAKLTAEGYDASAIQSLVNNSMKV